MRRLALALLVIIVAAGCLGSDFADSVEGSWRMVSGTIDGEEIPLADSNPVTIAFEGDRLNGVAACNSYSGTFDLDGSRITIGSVAMTEMACFPEELMQTEAMFGQALTRVDSVTLDDSLILSADRVELVFDRVEPVEDIELTNTVWALESLVDGDSVATPMAGTNATIEFFTDGSMLGNTGCRPFSGRYSISDAEVVVTEISADGHECEPDLAAQDSHFLSVIGDGFGVEIEGERLTVSGRDELGLVFGGSG